MGNKILEIQNLYGSFFLYSGEIKAVRGVSLAVESGETLAIVGESGCGKTVTAKSVMRLNPEPPYRIKSGSIFFNGKDLTKLSDKQMEAYRGKKLSMIFQDPMTSLNPTMKVGKQITESITKHENVPFKEAKQRAVESMHLSGIPNAEKNFDQYPHVFSGGMRQRIMIAMALSCHPSILFADEPTTALDVTMQAQILELMNELKEKTGTAIVLITHDFGVVARMADRIAVMYAGEIIETGPSREVFYYSQHPYTWGLLGSIPGASALTGTDLISIPGSPPDLFAPPEGCSFAPRCEYGMPVCRKYHPNLSHLGSGHESRCWLLDERAPDVEAPQIIRKRETVVSGTVDGKKR